MEESVKRYAYCEGLMVVNNFQAMVDQAGSFQFVLLKPRRSCQ